MSETSKWQLFLIIILVIIAGYLAYPSKDKPLAGKGELLENMRIEPGLDLQGGSELRLALKKEGLDPVKLQEYTDKAKEIIERRINLFGLKEPRIQRYGSEQILIQLPGMDIAEVERVKKIVTSSGKLEFKIEADPQIVKDWADKYPKAPAGYMWYDKEAQGEEDERSIRVLVKEKAIMTGEEIVKAGTHFAQLEGIVVDFKLSPHGTAIFANITKQYAKSETGEERKLAIILDSKLVSAPIINTPITGGEGMITGRFTLQQAQDLATVLRSGSMPASLEIVSENYVGPSLGEDAIRRGIMSFCLAVLAVVLFMLIYYHLSGLIAIIAMLMNFVLMVGILSFFGATLTMPGIAALVLTLGMAVDSNIIFYERIREEVKKGKDTFAAFETGFNRAFVTVIDCHVTAFLAGIILYYFGTGPLKGFAIVLCVGIVTTLFTNYFASRVMIRAIIEGGILKTFSMLKLFSKANVKWMSKSRMFMLMSLTLVILSVLLFVFKGSDDYGIDFTGGTVLNINFEKPVSIGEVRDTVLAITGIDPETKLTISKYSDAEVQSVITHLKGGVATGFGNILKGQEQFSSNEYSIRTKFVNTAEKVREFKNDLQTAFTGKIPADQIISSTTWTKLRDYSYRITISVPANTDTKVLQGKLKDRCTSNSLQEPFVAAEEGSGPAMSSTAPAQNKLVYIYFKDTSDAVLEKVVREELGFSAGPFSKVESIGGMVANELKRNAVIAIVLSWFGIILYLAFRFEFKFGVAAVIALIHDVLISLGSVVLFNIVVPKSWGITLEINLSSVAAFLTIIGYSVNDTIVVFDRIRENIKLLKGERMYKIIDISINETLGRTIWTSATVFMTVTVLFLITARSGGGIAAFAFPMIVGTVFGTYSSVYIASAWLLTGKERAEINQAQPPEVK